jgi:hypothetical protein
MVASVEILIADQSAQGIGRYDTLKHIQRLAQGPLGSDGDSKAIPDTATTQPREPHGTA